MDICCCDEYNNSDITGDIKMNRNSKYNPLGNFDEPMPPAEKWTGKPQWIRWILWMVRNPFHNFMFYWIGFKDRNLDYTQMWNTKQSWNLVLPFISKKFKSGWEFYIGWRPDTRSFGMALRRK